MTKFSKDKVLLLHQYIASETGGSVGLRDEGLLESALESAFATFGGKELYPATPRLDPRTCNDARNREMNSARLCLLDGMESVLSHKEQERQEWRVGWVVCHKEQRKD